MKTGDIIKRRAREIVQAAMGKPAHQITVGVQMKQCDECERTACENCPEKHAHQRLLETRSCINCGKAKVCHYLPAWGETIRINCIEWRPEKEQGQEGQT